MVFGIGFAYAALNGSGASTKPAQSSITLEPILEVRERFERRVGKAFNSTAKDSRSDLFSRWRPGISFTNGGNVSGTVQWQYSHDLSWTDALNSSTDNNELLLGFVKLKTDLGSFTVGRQRLIKGDQRILGESDWGNITNAFDVARYTNKNIDAFAGKLGVATAESKDARLVGGSYSWGLGETLGLYTHDIRKLGSFDIFTVDHLFKTKVMGFDASVEGAGQFGRYGKKDVEAFAGIAKVTKKFTPQWSAYIEGDIASGGNGSTNNEFTNFYASKHTYNGYADVQGLSNMEQLSVSTAYQYTKSLTSSLTYYRFGLFDPTDAWYNKSDAAIKSGATTLLDATGKSGRDVGQEIDWDNQWQVRKDTTVSGGLAEFIPGNFVKAFLGSKKENQVWLYAQVKYRY